MKYFLVLVVALGIGGCTLPPMSRQEAIELCKRRADQSDDQYWNDRFMNCMRAVGHGEALSNRLDHCGVSGLKCR